MANETYTGDPVYYKVIEDCRMNLVKLEPKTCPSDAVGKLEALLDRIKEGEFCGFMAVVMRPDGSYTTTFSGFKNSLETIGACECLKHDVMTASER